MKKKQYPGTRYSSRNTSHENTTVSRVQEKKVVVFWYNASARGWTTFASVIPSKYQAIHKIDGPRTRSDPYYATR